MTNQPLPELRMMHEMGGLGRDTHWFHKKDGVWLCACGAMRDAYGNPIPDVLVQASR